MKEEYKNMNEKIKEILKDLETEGKGKFCSIELIDSDSPWYKNKWEGVYRYKTKYGKYIENQVYIEEYENGEVWVHSLFWLQSFMRNIKEK